MEELSEKFISQVAKDKKVTKERATELIDLCMRLVSAQLGVNYSDVYNAIYSSDYLVSCVRTGKFCIDLSPEECEKSCQCVLFEKQCHPRYFEDAQIMNDDPDKYVEKMPSDKLLKLVKLASYLYYNYDGGGLSDNTFDAFEYHLNKKLKVRGRRYEKIGAEPIEKIRTNLPYPMASLNKVKPGSRELSDFMGDLLEIVWSLKLDGVSGLVVYKNGEPSKLYTRGTGIIGGDVTYLLDFINFPVLKSHQNIVVRGEFILPKSTWLEKYAPAEGVKHTLGYSNARSFVSAKINSGHVTQGLSDIVFVAYEIVDIDSTIENNPIPKPTLSFELLTKLGFRVVQNGILNAPTMFDIISLYRDVRASPTTEYFIDGLVLSINEERKKVEGKVVINPKHSVAFKMRLEDQVRTTKVLNVEWRKTRYGKLFPVVHFESIYVDGARIHKASGHNAAHIRDWSMGKGTVIKVVRSGDVIPAIVDVKVDNNILPLLPDATLTGPWHWKGRDIMLDNPDADRTVQIKRIEHFFVTIGVPRIREKTIEKLWDAGFREIKDYTHALPSDFSKVRGIGDKSAKSHIENIHKVMRTTRLDRFIPASTTLNIGIGRKLVKQLMRYHPTVLFEDSETIQRVLTKKKIPGFGTTRIQNVATNVPKFREFLFSINKEDIEYAIKHDEERRRKIRDGDFNPLIRGKTFVLTGFYGKVDLDFEDYIYDNLGNFSDTVTSSVSAVIAANLMDISKKMIDAHKLNVPVLSIQEFRKKFGIAKELAEDGDEEEGDEKALGIVDDEDED